MTDPEDIAAMEMPCQCDCGEFFDLHNGNTCRRCGDVFCTDCVSEPFNYCQICEPETTEDDDD